MADGVLMRAGEFMVRREREPDTPQAIAVATTGMPWQRKHGSHACIGSLCSCQRVRIGMCAGLVVGMCSSMRRISEAGVALYDSEY